MPIAKCDIFISYRRLDSAIFSQWLAASLRSAYGQQSVFIDTENLRGAEAWAQEVENSLRVAELVIVVIGTNWLSIQDQWKRRRIDLPDDWVRREVEVSLQEKKKILPLLIEGAELPARDGLPESIAPLLDIQARKMNSATVSSELPQLIKYVGETIGKTPIAVDVIHPAPMLRINALSDDNLRRLPKAMPNWQIISRVSDGVEKIELMRKFEFESFDDAIHFMGTASRFIDRTDHHPEWVNIWRTVVVYLTTWDIGFKPSMLDVDLATYLEDLYKSYVKKVGQQDLALP